MYYTGIYFFFSFLIFFLSLFYLMLQFQVNDNPIIIAFAPLRKVLEQVLIAEIWVSEKIPHFKSDCFELRDMKSKRQMGHN